MNNGLKKYNQPCAECGTFENLTRHHLKNNKGKKTGKTKILCRRCHNDVEEYYRLIGITKQNKNNSKDD